MFEAIRNKSLLMGAAAFAFTAGFVGLTVSDSVTLGPGTVWAESSGGQGKGNGQGGQGQGGHDSGGQTEGNGSQSEHGQFGQGKGNHLSGKDLGRLNMARSLVAPGDDSEETEEAEAPMMQIATYVDAVNAGQWQAAIDALGAAASKRITTVTVTKLNKILGISLPASWSAADLAAAADLVRQAMPHDHEDAH